MSGNRLTPGMTAPAFEAELWDGGRIELTGLRGKKIWLAFFRYASCPLCNLRVHEMIKQHGVFQKSGLDIVAVFQSPRDSVSKYVGTQKPPFPIIADADERLYQLYHLEQDLAGFLHPANLPLMGKALKLGFAPGKPDGTLTRIPADFLIDAQGIIRKAYYGDKIGDHIPFESVVKFAAEDYGK